jgi:hypothetical protein
MISVSIFLIFVAEIGKNSIEIKINGNNLLQVKIKAPLLVFLSSENECD